MRKGGIIFDRMMGVLSYTKLFSVLFCIIIMHMLTNGQLIAKRKSIEGEANFG